MTVQKKLKILRALWLVGTLFLVIMLWGVSQYNTIIPQRTVVDIGFPLMIPYMLICLVLLGVGTKNES